MRKVTELLNACLRATGRWIGRLLREHEVERADGLMKFSLFYELSPSGPFGVPEEGRTVLPPGQFYGPTFLTSRMVKVGHGSLPQYRDPDDALSEPLAFNGITGRISDNYLTLEVEAMTYQEAEERIAPVLESFLKHLTLAMGRSASAKILAIEGENRERFPISERVEMFAVTTYDVSSLRDAIKELQPFVLVRDERLERALDYFDHATFLVERRDDLVRGASARHDDFVIAAIFLNFWKAVTTIIGDPAERDYQSRYKTLGFDFHFFTEKVGRLKELRDSYDVAHHHLSPERVKEVTERFGEAGQIAREVIARYRDTLRPTSPRSRNSGD